MRLPRFVARLSLILALAAVSSLAYSQVAISISVAPPELPIYEQPPCPAPNLIWTPGYWSWSDDGYYWVPGAWVEAPAEGLLWTPGYWGYDNGNYMWNDGYWAPEVGFYGGVDYGYGYPGEGFYGGRWMGNTYSYNVTVVNVNTTVIQNTYRNEVQYRPQPNRVSYNGGNGGIQARPTAAQISVRQHRRSGPIQAQQRQAQLARSLPQNYAKANNGHPEHAAMERPARSASDFSRAVPARNARPGNNNRPENNRPNNARPNERPNNNARPENRPNAQPPQPEYRPTHPENRPNAQPQQPGYRTTHPETQPTARPNTQPHNNVRPAVPNREAQPQPQHEQRPEARPQQQHEQRPEARPQPQREQRPEARPEPHQQNRPEARPEHPEHPEHPAHPEHEKKQPQGI